MLRGRISQAITIVNRLYPGLLSKDKELLFRVMCRQFVEMVSGFDRLEEEEQGKEEEEEEESRREEGQNGDMFDGEITMDTDKRIAGKNDETESPPLSEIHVHVKQGFSTPFACVLLHTALVSAVLCY